jgi:putative ABC transport system substrate-binding protein
MDRRRFLLILLAGALAAPLAADAQQAAITKVGYLSTRSPREAKDVTEAFIQGLNEIGYVEGRNLAIQFRWAEPYYDRLPALASDLVRRSLSIALYVTESRDVRSETGARRHAAYNARASGNRDRTANGAAAEPVQ